MDSLNILRHLKDAVDAVGDMEAVGPVVVDHGPVVCPHGEDEGDQRVVAVSLNTEQIGEHEQSLPHLRHITQPGGVVGKSKIKQAGVSAITRSSAHHSQIRLPGYRTFSKCAHCLIRLIRMEFLRLINQI